MFKVLDLLSEGRLVAGIIPWVVDIERFSMNPDISPKKIRLDEAYIPDAPKKPNALSKLDTLRKPDVTIEDNETNEDENIDIEGDIDWDALD